ncbi:MAG: CotH kinase family protein [Lachnospiraceae bacterium]|nr:CotH kinase family protein [Lachnospiraceae bacterium]
MAQNQQRAPQRTAQRTQTGQRTQAGKKRISKKKKRQQRNRMLVMALVFALCVTGVVYFLWPKGGNGGDTKQTPTGSATPKPGDPTPTGTEISPGVIDPGGEDTIDWKAMPLTGLEFDEAMSSNSKYAELDGKFYDWVELLNSSSVAINLSEYWISDSKDNPQKYQLPNVTLGAGERYIIYCNGVGEGNQAPFKIKSSGEKIYLSNKDGFCDRIKIPGDLPADSSYGRKDGEWMYFDDPAPGRENGEGYAARTSVPEANYVTGVYNGPLMVTLFGEGTIYYTTDGSKPTTSSKVYVDGITVTGVTTIRAMAVKDGRESQEAAYTYVIDSTTHTLPILVVNGPYDTILGANGVVKKISDRNLEAQAMMTLIENGEEKFSIPCGITLHGNDSRNMAKQNFTVHFRSAYGASKLNYKLFDDIDLEVFNSILLKGGSERFKDAIIEDEFTTHMALLNSDVSAQACKPVVMYLAGEFWGIYFMRERFSADYVADHYDVPKDSVNIVQGYSGYQMKEEGSADDYNALVKFAKEKDLNIDENYEYLESRIDMNSLMDWYILRGYYGDSDDANIRCFMSTEGDGKWRWMFYDLDWGFCLQDHAFTTNVKNASKHPLIWYIIHSKRGKDAFLKRVAYLMDTCLNEEYITKELDWWKATLEPEIEAERARWGGTVNGWNSSMNVLYKYVQDGKRDKALLKDIKSLLGLSDSDMKAYFGDKWNP